MDDPEFTLIKATAEGDQQAFEQLVRLYQRPVLKFTCRVLGERHLAEDIAQEVFIRVYRSAAHFEPRGKVSSWIFKIAYNLCVSELRHRARFQRIQKELITTAPDTPASGAADELREELNTALCQLPENQRAALLLRVNEELSYAEISEVLSVSVSSVESLLHRARTRLRELLKKD
jgi:RNA polymerase sigma-70 factor, ECF subfamily